MKITSVALCAAIASVSLVSLCGCDDTKSKSKTTTTKTSELPNGDVKKTTETTEKKVEQTK